MTPEELDGVEQRWKAGEFCGNIANMLIPRFIDALRDAWADHAVEREVNRAVLALLESAKVARNRYHRALVKIMEMDYPNPANSGVWACKHGIPNANACENCLDAYIEEALK